MKSLLHIIIFCRALSCAWPVLPNTEEDAEKDIHLTGKLHSCTMNEIWGHRNEATDISEYTINPYAPRWKKKTLTYKISNYTQKMAQPDVDESIEKAFEVWSNHTCLHFSRSWGISDIDISFETGIHSDLEEDCPFDGESDTLAHALFSSEDGIKGYLHFDDDEPWTKGSEGVNLFFAAVHEIGHLLSLDHSQLKKAVMFPHYEKHDPTTFHLHQDDIDGVQTIYGRPGNCAQQPSQLEAPSEQEFDDVCDYNGSFDAATTFQGDVLLFVNGYILWKGPEGRPPRNKPTAFLWPILKCGIDAAYEVEDTHTLYLFKGMKYRTVVGDIKNLSLPQITSNLGFPAARIDAAVHDQETKKTLFFSDNAYWRYDEETRSMEEGYPRRIAADFPEIGSQVDAAFQKHGSLFLFRGSKQYEFDRTTYKLLSIKKNNSWLGCPE